LLFWILRGEELQALVLAFKNASPFWYCSNGQCIVMDILVSGFLSQGWQSFPSKNSLHEVYSLKRKCQFHASL